MPKTKSTQLYKLICEGECSQADAKANVLRLERKLEEQPTLTGKWDGRSLGPSITRALRRMTKTFHRMVDEQTAKCQNCGHGRPYGNSMFLEGPTVERMR